MEEISAAGGGRLLRMGAADQHGGGQAEEGAFAGEQLPLSLEAAGHVPPVSQGLEASAENSKEKVSVGSSVAEGRRALLQVSSHLLETAADEEHPSPYRSVTRDL